MTTLQWHFPDRLSGVLPLMKEGFSPHAGGTWLMKRKPEKGFIELSGIGELFLYERKNGIVEAGSMLTFADLAEQLRHDSGDHLLIRALGSAASTTLRNRITIGGSLAAFPAWSDLAAPLALIGAEVLLAGAEKAFLPVEDYLKDTTIRKTSFIRGVRFPAESSPCGYYRHVRTTFDYPAFTIAALCHKKGVRAAVGGTKDRVHVYEELSEDILPEIPGRFGSSGEYLSHCAAVELGRLVRSVGEADL